MIFVLSHIISDSRTEQTKQKQINKKRKQVMFRKFDVEMGMTGNGNVKFFGI